MRFGTIGIGSWEFANLARLQWRWDHEREKVLAGMHREEEPSEPFEPRSIRALKQAAV